MYNDFHSQLFSYASWLQGTNISRIEISDGKVLMVSRDHGVKIICPELDKRVAPIEILNFGNYELTDSAMIMKLVKSNACVLDIGANMGWYALNIAKQNPNATVYAFEPIGSTYLALQENVRINELNNIKTYNFGFSSEEKTLDFYFYPGGSGNASSANLSGRSDVEKVTCDVKVLDDTSTTLELPKVDFIKCDVEGAELFVFQGALKLLAKDKPIVFTEMLRKWAAKFDYHPNEIINLFRSLGYQCFTAEAGGTLVKFGLMDEQTQETNFFFLHETQHAIEINELLAT
ncbi:hypothetical protein BHE74_00000146 [Ensete ventricosum]|nr:hypothetical protein BHE74_00000146 [Ensete ventricosum]